MSRNDPHLHHEWQPGPMLARNPAVTDAPIFVVLVCRCGAIWPKPVALEDRIQHDPTAR
jgi:hypothetical protein